MAKTPTAGSVPWGRISLIVAVAVLAGTCAWPPENKITLGLDLQGGTHMVLKVDLDQAVGAHRDRKLDQLRKALQEAGYSPKVRILGPAKAEITGLTRVADVEELLSQHGGNWAFSWTGDVVTASMTPGAEKEIRDGSSQQVRETLGRRIDALGVAEPSLRQQGLSGEKIVLQLPGLDDAERAKRIITTTSNMEFRLGKAEAATQEELLAAHGGELPDELEAVPGDPSDPRIGGRWFALERAAVTRGEDLLDARETSDQYGRPAIGFQFNSDAGERFRAFTSKNVGNPLAVVLDDRVIQYARIESTIGSSGIITGSFSAQEARDAALTLRAGALPARVDVLFEQTVGPSLGRESIRAGFTAAAAGLLIVVAFMLVWYKRAGVNAVVALFLNLLIVMGALAALGATLTLPGIAGLILTIGMAVDANVIIFERIKEELAIGKSPQSAVEAGFDKALSSILDANVTTLIAAFFLGSFGTGPIKGFAVTLGLGIVSSMFTAIFVSRTIFDVGFVLRPAAKGLSISWLKRGGRRFAFMRFRTLGALISGLALLGSAGLWMGRGLNYGIDFAGGTAVVVKTWPTVTADDLRHRLVGSPHEAVAIQRFGEADKNEFLLRVKADPGEAAIARATVNAPSGEETGRKAASTELVELLTAGEVPEGKLDLNEAGRGRIAAALAGDGGLAAEVSGRAADAITALKRDQGIISSWDQVTALPDLPGEAGAWLRENAGLADVRSISTESVGAEIGAELRNKAFGAVAFSLGAILIYLRIRFGWRYGLAAVAALAHDVVITVGVFALVGHEINISIIAALLTIVGYSLNDTIVVFDRIRENRTIMKRESLREVIDTSLSQTLSRTLLTSGTTLFVVLSLLLKGGPVLEGFALALTVGVLVGTYSSVFIASPFVLLVERRAGRAAAPQGSEAA